MIKGIIHCHTENSRYDSALKIKDLLEGAKEKGYSAVALTEHSTLTSMDDFVAQAKAMDIKPIPGIELDVRPDNDVSENKHIILLAKDDIGYQGICKVITEANQNIDDDGIPCTNKKMLEKYFSEGTKYHGHVIATSACLKGIICSLATEPFYYKEEKMKLEEELKAYPTDESPSYLINKKNLEKRKAELDSLIEERERLSKIAKRPYKKKENALLKLDGAERDAAEAALLAEKKESRDAAEKVEDVKLKIALTKRYISEISKRIKADEEKFPKADAIRSKIKLIESMTISEDELKTLLINELKYYQNLFGKEDFYVELQYHGYQGYGIPLEGAVMHTIAALAKEVGVKLCASNDVHMKDNTMESLRARQILMAIKLGTDDKPFKLKHGDEELYIKSEAELRPFMCKVIKPELVDEAINGTYEICEKCNCDFNYGTHYPKFPVKDGETADGLLRDLAYKGIEERFPNKEGWTKVYEERLDYELSVIAQMGYSDYFLIVRDFLDFGRKLGKLSDEDLDYLRANVKKMSLCEYRDFVEIAYKLPGFGIGAGRGSAAGSLVAYLVGITNIIDPLKYDLLFERFLNKDRVSMPVKSGI